MEQVAGASRPSRAEMRLRVNGGGCVLPVMLTLAPKVAISAVHYPSPRRSRGLLVLAALASALGHFVFLSWKPLRPAPPRVAAEPSAVIEIAMPPPPEPGVGDTVEELGDGTDQPSLAPPQLADVPSVQVSAFT